MRLIFVAFCISVSVARGDEPTEFLNKLLDAPSPSGFEQPAQRIVRQRMKPFADEIRSDVHGNTIVAINPKGYPRIMLAGHCDQVGFMVRHISDDGYVHFASIGGVDASVVPGLRLTIHGAGGAVDGVVGKKAVHLMKPDERGRTNVEISELWLDIGAKNREAAAKRVAIGDSITYKASIMKLEGGLIASPGTDDKVGVFVVMEAIRQIRASGKPCPCAIFAVSTVQEELGFRGAHTSCFGLDPQVGIAVDVCHASDYPGIDKRIAGDIVVGKGPVITTGPNINPVMAELLLSSAKGMNLPFQRIGEPSGTGTDANAIQISRAGVAAALVSIPNRYMHTPVEVVSLTDIENAAKLLADVCLKISSQTSFVPQ